MAEGTLNEKINGYEFWFISLHFFAQESVHYYNTIHFRIVDGDLYFYCPLRIFIERIKEIYKLITNRNCKEEAFNKINCLKKIKNNKCLFLRLDTHIAFNIRQLLKNMPNEIHIILRKYMCFQCIEEERENLYIDRCKWHNLSS